MRAFVQIYSQRNVAMIEQRASAEVARTRQEMQQTIEERDRLLSVKQTEVQELQALAVKQKEELDRLAGENGILKQGVRIQANLVEKAQAEKAQQHAQQSSMLSAAAEHIRTLEAANHGLRVQLEQMAAHGGSMLSPSRWGESH